MLPASAVEILKLVDSKSLKEYIDEDNMLKCWGGKDDYVYSFELEDVPLPKSAVAPSIANKKVNFNDKCYGRHLCFLKVNFLFKNFQPVWLFFFFLHAIFNSIEMRIHILYIFHFIEGQRTLSILT